MVIFCWSYLQCSAPSPDSNMALHHLKNFSQLFFFLLLNSFPFFSPILIIWSKAQLQSVSFPFQRARIQLEAGPGWAAGNKARKGASWQHDPLAARASYGAAQLSSQGDRSLPWHLPVHLAATRRCPASGCCGSTVLQRTLLDISWQKDGFFLPTAM